jgi:hypothetical protein
MKTLITGAAGGLGRAMAIECARRGHSLVLTDRDPDGLERFAQGLGRQYGIYPEIMVCDLTDEAGIRSLMDRFDAENVTFDMLLNIAGLDNEGGFLRRDCDRILDIVKVNVEATLRFTHELLRRRNDPFHIVFVSSLASQFPMPLKATYAASKRFLFDFALALGEELKDSGVHVLALCPGGLPTTPGTIAAIDAQGFFGKATTNRLEVVSRKTIDRVLRGDPVYFPGILNNLFRILNPFLPKRFVIRLIHKRWIRSQARWLKTES